MRDEQRLRKLKWQCRRGMKELDLLLANFLQTHATALSNGAWPEFEQLLAIEDDRLWTWLQHPSDPRAAAYGALLGKIRDVGG